MMVMQAILEKIQEKIDEKCPSDQYDLKGMERSKEMKLVMPNTSAGLVIGKGGNSIKEIRESAGASIQVYPKAGSEVGQNLQSEPKNNVLLRKIFKNCR